MRRLIPSGVLALAAMLALAACDDLRAKPRQAPAPPPRAATAGPHALDVPTPAPLAAPPIEDAAVAEAPDDPQAVAVNLAQAPSAATASAKGADPGLLRAQVLLDRAHFSPGVIDGRPGENLRHAVAAFETAHDLPADGQLDDEVWTALTQADAAPAIVRYTITPADVAGPFAPAIPKDYSEMAQLEALSYTSPIEALAETFHMDQRLLQALNPTADFAVAGTVILVAAVRADALPTPVAAIEVDKTARQLRAFGADGRLLAAYPATVGSTERPAPAGVYKVTGVTRDPAYTYDPARLTFGPRSKGKLTIKPGPNNPVGAVWIDLSIPTYGVHGAPDPQLVGKVASHGCVRLTNWDARQLAAAVKPGVKVSFVGAEGGAKA